MDRAMSGLQPCRVPPTSKLIAFESAARHGNFSHAAQELETSQTAISRHMARLETQLGVRLFERSRTGVRLAEAGRRFRDAVASGLGALRAGAADAATLSAEARPEVAIACADEVSHLFLMPRVVKLAWLTPCNAARSRDCRTGRRLTRAPINTGLLLRAAGSAFQGARARRGNRNRQIPAHHQMRSFDICLAIPSRWRSRPL